MTRQFTGIVNRLPNAVSMSQRWAGEKCNEERCNEDVSDRRRAKIK
jgi:hypothetical protein